MKTIIALLILLSSCTKTQSESVDDSKYYAVVTVDAKEQDNVESYAVEISTDGKTFEQYGLILSNDSVVTKYTIKVDVTDIMKENKYFRVKAIDFDKKYTYSHIVNIRQSL